MSAAPNLELPKNPQVGDCILTTKKALCGCVYDIRCRWDGRMWAYISSPFCTPHGSHGMELVGVKADEGQRLAAPPRNVLGEMLDLEKSMGGGRVSASVVRTLTRTVLDR